jgi:hypothetical protein
MKLIYFLVFSVFFVDCTSSVVKQIPNSKNKTLVLNQQQAERLVSLPLKCVQKEYPNKLMQTLNDSSDLLSPEVLHPAFYGCFDWHSSVHGHWLMVTLLKKYPKIKQAEKIRQKLNKQLTKENIQKEVDYFSRKYAGSFERTYGWVWLLKLQYALSTFDDKDAKTWAKNLQPLSDLIVSKYMDFLPKLNYPIRTGTHSNTAFGLTFAYDYALLTANQKLQNLIMKRAKDFYLKDKKSPLAYEPSGYDFLSPTFETMDLMRRVLSKVDFYNWVKAYLPQILSKNFTLEVGKVSDRTDGHLVHLDGLNFSRAWCLYALAHHDVRFKHLIPLADKHLAHSLPSVADGDYMGEHWLASFALQALIEKESGAYNISNNLLVKGK